MVFFYTSFDGLSDIMTALESQLDINRIKLNQVASEIKEQKLNQVGSEMMFPAIFAYVPWRHHVLITQKCKTIEEALTGHRLSVYGSCV